MKKVDLHLELKGKVLSYDVDEIASIEDINKEVAKWIKDLKNDINDRYGIDIIDFNYSYEVIESEESK